MRIWPWQRKIKCQHHFYYEDLSLTGIKELEKPENNNYELWVEYFSNYYNHDSIKKRVEWPCCKCGKIFYAHCGLDIISGKNISWRPAT